MELDFTVLKEVGLTDAQIKVYMSLIELGEVTSGSIIKKSGLQSSVVYNAINQLLEIGLISFVSKGKRKYFSAKPLKNLLDFIEDKKTRIAELIKKIPTKKTDNENVEVFFGWRGIYTVFNTILEELPPNSDYLAFAGDSSEKYPQEAISLFKEFQKKRNYRRYKVKIIANSISRNNIKNYKYYNEFGKPNYRYVNELSPSEMIIFNDSIVHLSLKDRPLAILIRSKDIADSFRRFFYNMWKIAKK